MAVLVESPTAPRMFMESSRSFLYVIPVNQVRDRYLSSNCHKRVNLLQIIVRVGECSASDGLALRHPHWKCVSVSAPVYLAGITHLGMSTPTGRTKTGVLRIYGPAAGAGDHADGLYRTAGR
jgi:hypothetical protein